MKPGDMLPPRPGETVRPLPAGALPPRDPGDPVDIRFEVDGVVHVVDQVAALAIACNLVAAVEISLGSRRG